MGTETPVLEVGGLVGRPRGYTYAELSALGGQVPDVSKLAPDRQGVAVRLSSIVDDVESMDEARYITLYANGDYSARVPLDAVADQAVLIYRFGDGPLPVEKGGPVRFFIPDVAACQTAEVDTCANVKYLRRIELSAEPGRDVRPKSAAQHVELHRGE